MVSRILLGASILLASTAMAAPAMAGCNGSTYCSSPSSAALPSLGSWNDSAYTSTGAYSYESAPSTTYSSGTSYSYGGSSYGGSYGSSSYGSSAYGSSSYGSSYGGVMSASEADAKYGSGSISSAYTGGDVELYGFSGSTVPGLGANESLQATNCPVNVYNPEGARVLGCYNVVKPQPVANTTYYRVVRPVVYVRYPVPVAVPYWSGCTVVTHASRYGDRWGRGGFHGRRCG